MRGIAALQIDFQQRPETGAPRSGWIVLALGALLLSGAYAEHSHVETRLEAVRARVEQTRQIARHVATSKGGQQSADAGRAVSLVRAQLGAPWGRMLAAVESAVDEDIALLALQADHGAGTLRVSGEARNFSALMAYVRRLEASPALAEARLTGHEVRQQDPQRPVVFALSASWGIKP